MIDGIIKADGTSRLMRAELPATYEEFRARCATGTQPLDVLFNAIGWSQMPTFLNKFNLLKDETAELFGLDSGIVLDEMFSWLGKYNTHWWSVLHGQAGKGYNEARTSATTLNKLIGMSREYSYSQTIYYSKTVTIDQSSGAVSLSNPQSMTVSGGTGTAVPEQHLKNIIALAPVYITNLYDSPTTVFYIPEGATYTDYLFNTSQETFGLLRFDSGYGIILNCGTHCAKPAQIVSSQIYSIPAGETTYEHSTDRNAFPDSGTVNGLTYQYLGVPFQKFPSVPQIAIGSYVGTGKAGNNNKNSLTFGFTPRLVVISDASNEVMVMSCRDVQTGCHWHTSSAIYYCYCQVSGNTVTWWNTAIMPVLGSQDGASANGQKDSSGTTYYFLAIG